jgi:hypothetical protein
MGYRGFNKDRVEKRIDEEVRNALIVNTWDLLTGFTEVKYKDKIQYLMDRHHLSYSRIEDIINLDKDEKGVRFYLDE